MLHTDNELIYQIIRTAHDPDPRRAARFRPFAYSAANFPRSEVQVTLRQPLTMATVRSLPRTLSTWARGFAPFKQPQPVPCCLAAV